MDKSKLIYPGDFVTFKKDIGDTEFSVTKGTHGYVAGVIAIPEKENDPYTQRVKFYINIVNTEGRTDITRFFVVDPKSLKLAKEPDAAILLANLQRDYGENGDGATTH